MDLIFIKECLITLNELDNENLDIVINAFEKATLQTVPKDVRDKFAMSGLCNSDFLTSDFLNSFGLKNILQVDLGKCAYRIEKALHIEEMKIYGENSVKTIPDPNKF